MSREMKNSGIPWIGDIPIAWKTERIKTIFSERTELSEDGSEDLLSVSEYYGVDKRSSKVDDGEFISRSESLVGYKKCYEGDFVSNIMLAWKGSLGVAHQDGIVSPAYCVYKPSDKIFPQYYHYLFRTSLYTGRFKCYSKGIIDSRLRLYTPYFFDITAIIPPLPEQKSIADFLDRKCAEIDEMIALQEKIIDELKAYKQSVIAEAVTKGLDPTVEMKDSDVEWIGLTPKLWNTIKLKHLGSVSKTLINPQDMKETLLFEYSMPAYDENKTPRLVQGQNLDSAKLFLTAPVLLINKLNVHKERIWYVDNPSDNAVASTEFVPITIKNALPRYVEYSLHNQGVTNHLILCSKGATNSQKRVSPDDIKNLIISVPSVYEQHKIIDFLDRKCSEIDSLISTKNDKIEELKEYKRSFIFEYVTGKKEVPYGN